MKHCPTCTCSAHRAPVEKREPKPKVRDIARPTLKALVGKRVQWKSSVDPRVTISGVLQTKAGSLGVTLYFVVDRSRPRLGVWPDESDPDQGYRYYTSNTTKVEEVR